jgi:NADH:ubiquinone oxidoreductase subunit 6 (subunit J)
MGLNIAFWVISAVVVVAALAVVIVRNVFRAALALILCFLGVAAVYITLSADFLAVVQILIYVGGISILILLAIMLTRDIPEGSPANRLRIPAFLVSAILLALMVFSFMKTTFPVSSAEPVAPTANALGQTILSSDGFLIPLEIAGLLILAAILGAVVMAREK